MTGDAIAMMIISVVFYVGGFAFCLNKGFKKDKADKAAKADK